MHLTHLDLQVSNVHAARIVFDTHVGVRCVAPRRDALAVLDAARCSLGMSNLFHHATPSYPRH